VILLLVHSEPSRCRCPAGSSIVELWTHDAALPPRQFERAAERVGIFDPTAEGPPQRLAYASIIADGFDVCLRTPFLESANQDVLARELKTAQKLFLAAYIQEVLGFTPCLPH
jgi:hypothetical protein